MLRTGEGCGGALRVAEAFEGCWGVLGETHGMCTKEWPKLFWHQIRFPSRSARVHPTPLGRCHTRRGCGRSRRGTWWFPRMPHMYFNGKRKHPQSGRCFTTEGRGGGGQLGPGQTTHPQTRRSVLRKNAERTNGPREVADAKCTNSNPASLDGSCTPQASPSSSNVLALPEVPDDAISTSLSATPMTRETPIHGSHGSCTHSSRSEPQKIRRFPPGHGLTPGGGGIWVSARVHPPPGNPPPLGGSHISYPTPTDTYMHTLQKSALAVLWRKDATLFRHL